MTGGGDARGRSAPPIMVLADDPSVIAAARKAARRARRPAIQVMSSGQEALARVTAPDAGAGHLVCDPATAGTEWPALLRAFADPANRTALVLVGRPVHALPAGIAAVAPKLAELHSVFAAATRARSALPRDAAAALARAIARGDITVSYQPVVGIADRRPILVEALARWPYRQRLIDPGAFVPLSERSGLAGALATAVTRRVARDAATHWRGLPLGISINLPLELVLQPALPSCLTRAFARSGLRPSCLSIELTETARDYDRGTLRRALRRLRASGHDVLLDDVQLHDPRRRLFTLPFAGLKLDRAVTERMSHSFAARLAVRRLVTAAHRRGQRVIAEGVSDARLWRLVRAAGLDAAQGWFVGRPVPPKALQAWRAGWRQGGGGC